MTVAALSAEDRRHWSVAASVAAVAHLGVAAAALAWVRPAEAPLPDPVVTVELPADPGPPSATTAQPATQPQPQPAAAPPQTATPPMDIPPVRAPLPAQPVTLPPPAPAQPVRAAAPVQAAEPAASAPEAPSAPAATRSSGTPGDPRARKQEADYFALVSAHLNRRKTYPAEARQARQQGVVTVRFTVDRAGNVTGISIKRGSGHDILDRATLDLVRRVAPLPRMPGAMQRDSITLSLPIDYSLRTD